MTPLPLAKEIWFGGPLVLACDGNCRKAWGINNRPRVQLSPDDPDDHEYLADHELPDAPADPGTYEGGHGKPNPDGGPGRQNKWCARECERSRLFDLGVPVDLPSFDKRRRNKPSSDTEALT